MDKLAARWKNTCKTAVKFTYTGAIIVVFMILYSADLWAAVVFVGFTCQYELYPASRILLQYLTIDTGLVIFGPFMLATAVIMVFKQELVRHAVRTRELLAQREAATSGGPRTDRRRSDGTNASNQHRRRGNVFVVITFLLFSSACFGCSLFCRLNTVQRHDLYEYLMNNSFSNQNSFERLSFAWDEIQYKGDCCGVNNFTDYLLINSSTPLSCCYTSEEYKKRVSYQPMPPAVDEDMCRQDALMRVNHSQYLKTEGCYSLILHKIERVNTAFALICTAFCLDIISILFATYFEIKNYCSEKRARRIRQQLRESLGLVPEEDEHDEDHDEVDIRRV